MVLIWVVFPGTIDILVVLDNTTNLHLWAEVVKLQEYMVTWENGRNPWEALNVEQLVVNQFNQLQNAPPQVVHCDVVLHIPDSQK